jgi:hypothetical protein
MANINQRRLLQIEAEEAQRQVQRDALVRDFPIGTLVEFTNTSLPESSLVQGVVVGHNGFAVYVNRNDSLGVHVLNRRSLRIIPRPEPSIKSRLSFPNMNGKTASGGSRRRQRRRITRSRCSRRRNTKRMF